MISIARTFGAPVIEPPGNAACSKSSGVLPRPVSLRQPKRDAAQRRTSPNRTIAKPAHWPVRRRAIGRSATDRRSSRSLPDLSRSASTLRRDRNWLRPAKFRARSFNGACFDLPVLSQQEPLGRGAANLELAQIEVAGERGGVPLAAIADRAKAYRYRPGVSSAAKDSPETHRRHGCNRSPAARLHDTHRPRSCS